MRLVSKTSNREIVVTLCIWAALMTAAIVGLMVLRKSTDRIIEELHYVNVNRVAKSTVLYAEAEKHAKAVLDKAEDLNLESEKKILVPASDEHLKKSVSLFEQAQALDQRPEFAPERRVYYEMQGQVHDAAGHREEQLLSHARAFMTQGNYDDALKNITAAQDSGTSSVKALTLLAQLNDVRGETTVALSLLQDAGTSLPLDAKALWVRGDLYRKTGDIKRALTDFQSAVQAAPENLTYRQDLAVAQRSVGTAEEAAKIMEAGLDDGGWLDAAYLHVYGEYLVEVGNLDEAIRVLKQADKLAPYSGDVQWSLARAYHRAGKPRYASSTLRRATEIRPELQDQIF